MPEQKTFVIDLYLSRRMTAVLTVVVVALVMLAALLLARGSASAANRAAPAAAPAMRQYYLTKTPFYGTQAVGACAAGYHFASLWEIMHTATLSYNTTLGQTLDDSGQGPPDFNGWVRTGNVSGSSPTAGVANCNNWTSNTGYYGTVARPSDNWTPAQATFEGWVVQAVQWCYPGARVWCVED